MKNRPKSTLPRASAPPVELYAQPAKESVAIAVKAVACAAMAVGRVAMAGKSEVRGCAEPTNRAGLSAMC